MLSRILYSPDILHIWPMFVLAAMFLGGGIWAILQKVRTGDWK